MKYRSTIEKEIRFSGIGVHSGKIATIVLKPAVFGQGICLYGPETTEMHWKYLHDSYKTTTLKFADGKKITMVEHLLAACYGLGITDLNVEIDAEEGPIFDGSAKMYVQKLLEAGRKESLQETSWLVLTDPIYIAGIGNQFIRLTPGEPTVSVKLYLDSSLIHNHTFHCLKDSFARDISLARTFANLSDVQKLRQRGLIKGGSLSSAIVLHQGKAINQGGFRMSNECARHKILDILGDFALLGKFFYGGISASMPGHSLNHQAILGLMANPNFFKTVPFSQLPFDEAPKIVHMH